jgi:uncharacterized membrane protein HdeD (DUF308 family)
MSINNAAVEKLRTATTAAIQGHWKFFLAEGIVLLLLGIAAIVVPPVATIAVELIIGWLFLLSGLVGLFTTFSARRAPGFWWSLLSAILGLVVGIILIRWPISGAVSLKLVLTVFFLLEGVASIMYALEHRRESSGRWSWMLFSGVIDLVLAGIILFGLPGTAAWAIGLLAGINLLFGGIALIAMALHARPSDQQATMRPI